MSFFATWWMRCRRRAWQVYHRVSISLWLPCPTLTALGSKIDPKVAEATWVHKIFGGRLRSRVHCRACGHNSDTFDRVLDLSVDISRAISLRDALKQFVEIDVLKGADKYKCEKYV